MESSDLIKLLTDKSVVFSDDELNKIIETELGKDEKERDSVLIEVCRSLLNDKREAPVKKSKKAAYIKIIVFAAAAVILILVNIAAFGKLRLNAAAPVSESVAADKTDSALTTSEQKTEKANETAIGIAEKTTRVPTTYKLDIKSCICKPEKIVFFSDGEERILSQEINKNVVNVINKYLADEYKGSGLKYVAEPTMINEIKSQPHIEIYYDSIQAFLAENPSDERTYNHLLIPLIGQYENIIFFGKYGKYQPLPIGPLPEDTFNETLFGVIYD